MSRAIRAQSSIATSCSKARAEQGRDLGLRNLRVRSLRLSQGARIWCRRIPQRYREAWREGTQRFGQVRESPAADIFGLADLSDDVSTFRKARKYSRETPKRSSTLPPPNSATRITS